MIEELPEGWASAQVSQLLQLVNGFPFKPTQWGKNGLPIIRIQNLNNPEAPFNHCSETIPEKFRVGRGDLLFAWSGTPGTSFGAHIWNGDDAWLNQHIFRVEFAKGLLDKQFVRHAINQNLDDYIHQAHGGAGLAHITKGKFDASFLRLPPLAEQQRIVAKVEALLTRVNAARQRLAKAPAILKRFRQSVLAAACSGCLTADYQECTDTSSVAELLAEIKSTHEGCGSKRSRSRKGANSARNEGDDADGLDLNLMPDLPEAWSYARADDIVEPGTIVTYGIVLPGPNVDQGVPYVRGLDIENGQVLVDQLWKTTHAIAAKHERSRLEPGDVLLCVIRHLKVAIVPDRLRGGNLTQGTVRLRPSKAILGSYLTRYLESPAAQGWMKSRYFGMDMPRINVEDARALPIPVPPLAKQHEIVRRVEALFKLSDAIEKRVAATTARADKLTQAILARAFRGELVPTEAELARRNGRDYEPASVLLKRVRAEREKSNECAARQDRKSKPKRVSPTK
jgi:type I restriction enzyme, S subunit